jgi:hypothetical protein
LHLNLEEGAMSHRKTPGRAGRADRLGRKICTSRTATRSAVQLPELSPEQLVRRDADALENFAVRIRMMPASLVDHCAAEQLQAAEDNARDALAEQDCRARAALLGYAGHLARRYSVAVGARG